MSTSPDHQEMLRANWWSHDGQWFLKAVEAVGVETAMAINEEAIESMGRIEMRRLHSEMGGEPVIGADDFLPLAVAAQEMIGIPAEGEMDGENSFTLAVETCRVWDRTEAACLTTAAPGCRGSLRRRLGWGTVFFDPHRVVWTREVGRPDGDPRCRYRFRLRPADE